MWPPSPPVALSTMANSHSDEMTRKRQPYTGRALLSGALFAVSSCLAAGTASAATPSAGRPYLVKVQANHTLTAIGPSALGVNTRPWAASLLTPPVPGLVHSAGIRGSGLQRWANGRPVPLEDKLGRPAGREIRLITIGPRYNFDQWATFARSQHETMLVHINYGTGTPSEAAAWVRYANLDKHYGVRYWEVG